MVLRPEVLGERSGREPAYPGRERRKRNGADDGIVQLLHKLSIRGVQGSEKLLRVVKNPVTEHFPTNTIKLSESSLSLWQF